MTTTTENLNNANTQVTAINELIEKTSDIGLSLEAGNLLFDVLVAALGKAERARTTAMIEERKERNKQVHATIDAQS